MAETTRNPEPQQEPRKGLLATMLRLPWHILGILVASLVLSVVFEFIGIAFFWSDEGWRHSQSMFHTELGWLSDSFRRSVIIQEPGRTVSWLLEQCYEWLFVKTGFIDFTVQARSNSARVGTLGYASKTYLLIEDYALATVYVTLVFVIRLMVLVLSIPLFLLAFVVGATDGLMRRDLRRFGAGRESSFIYHRAKRTVIPLLVLPWILYLALPVSVHPALVLLPCAFGLGLSVLITTATFKKYL